MDQGRAPTLAPIALAAVTLVAAGCSSGHHSPPQHSHQRPSSTGSTGATPARTFASRRYGFRVTLPGNWSGHDATADWDGKELPGIDGPEWANLTDGTTNRTLDVAAAITPAGLARWKAAVQAAEVPHTCLKSSSVAKTSLGGEPALAWTAACKDGYDLDNLAALHGKHGYVLFLASSTPGTNAAHSHRIFESIRRSFRFTRASR